LLISQYYKNLCIALVKLLPKTTLHSHINLPTRQLNIERLLVFTIDLNMSSPHK